MEVWDCICGEKAIFSNELECPSCGMPHNPVAYTQMNYYKDPKHRTVPASWGPDLGPNWNCGNPKCGGTCNTGNLKVCRKCGQPRDGDDVQEATTTWSWGKDLDGTQISTEDDLRDARREALLSSSDKLAVTNADNVVTPHLTLAGLPPTTAMVDDWQADRRQQRLQDDRPQDRFQPLFGRRLPFGGLRVIGVAVGALVLILGLVFAGTAAYDHFVRTENVELTVQSTSWERSYGIEVLEAQMRNGWSVPYGGRVLGSNWEIRTYNKVYDHTDHLSRRKSKQVPTGSHRQSYTCGGSSTSSGSGRIKSTTTTCYRSVTDYTTVYYDEPYDVAVYRQVPVYGTKYTYMIDVWMSRPAERMSGVCNDPNDCTPLWPTLVTSPRLRTTGRHEDYRVQLLDPKGRKIDKSIGLDSFWALHPHDTVKAKETKSGHVTYVALPS
jgi:hypothetical protein